MCIVLETAGGRKQLRFEKRSISKVNEIPAIKIRSHPKGKFNFTSIQLKFLPNVEIMINKHLIFSAFYRVEAHYSQVSLHMR